MVTESTGPSVADLASHIREVTAVRPGDVLVIRLAPQCTAEEMAAFVERFKAEPLDGVKVVTLGGSVELHVLRTGEQP